MIKAAIKICECVSVIAQNQIFDESKNIPPGYTLLFRERN